MNSEYLPPKCLTSASISPSENTNYDHLLCSIRKNRENSKVRNNKMGFKSKTKLKFYINKPVGSSSEPEIKRLMKGHSLDKKSSLIEDLSALSNTKANAINS